MYLVMYSAIQNFSQEKPYFWLLLQYVLKIFYQDLVALAKKSPTFGYSYSTRNILPRFSGTSPESPNFGKSYSTRNLLPRFVQIIQKP